jgi:hypothetical protein
MLNSPRGRPEPENRPGFFLAVPGRTFSRHPEVAAHFARPSKDRGRALAAYPSRLGMKNAEHLRMTAVLCASVFPKKLFHPGLPNATFSRFGFEHLKMQYRGKHYIVIQGIEPDSWKWTVDLDEQTSKSGEAKTRGLAVSAVVLLVDRLLTRNPRSSAA